MLRKNLFPSPSANKNLGAALADGNLNFPQTRELMYRLEKNERKFSCFPKVNPIFLYDSPHTERAKFIKYGVSKLLL